MIVGSSIITVPSSTSSSSTGQSSTGIRGVVNPAIDGGFASPTTGVGGAEAGATGTGGVLAFTGNGVRERARWEVLIGGVLGTVGVLGWG